MLRPYITPALYVTRQRPLQAPPRPIVRMDVLVRDAHVRHLAVLRVDLQRPAQPDRETPEQDHRRQASGVAVERRARRRPALARRDPLGVDAGRMRILRLLRWRRVAARDALLAGREPFGVVAVRPGGGLAVAAGPDLPARLLGRPGQLVGHFDRPRRIEAAVAPHAPHPGALALRREAVADAGAGGRGLLEERVDSASM